jgi:acetate kinase
MNVLVLNCGSSSLKFQVIETDLEKIDRPTPTGSWRAALIERIGSQALVTFRVEKAGPAPRHPATRPPRRARLRAALAGLARGGGREHPSLSDIHAVGHRVVHGGERFRRSVRIDDEVIAQIEDCIELAPLHNPANLKGIRAARELLGPGVPQVAVFDTSFHSTMPRLVVPLRDPLPALPPPQGPPLRLPRHLAPLRRLPLPQADRPSARGGANIITLHLGNGCSACAIKGGDSVDTSMGFTPSRGW